MFDNGAGMKEKILAKIMELLESMPDESEAKPEGVPADGEALAVEADPLKKGLV